MAGQDTERRIAILTGLSSHADLSADEARRVLDASLSYFLNFTHRIADPGAAIDYIIVDIALVRLSKDGVEGVRQAKDGSMMRVFDDGGMPPEVLAEMKSWRVIQGVNHASYGP